MYPRALTSTLATAILFVAVASTVEATVDFDFSGLCLSGDCEPGSEVSGVLQFHDGASLRHGNRLVTADDFVSLVLSYFTPVQRVQVESRFAPSEGSTLQPIDVVLDVTHELTGIALGDGVQNAFLVGEKEPGVWQYRQVATTPNGQLVDVTLGGNEGVFVRQSALAPEPGAVALVGVGLALFAAGALLIPGWPAGRSRSRRRSSATSGARR